MAERGTMTGAEVLSIPRSVEKPSAYAWVILAVLYIASVASALNQFKVPPVLPVLIRAFNLSLSNAGMLMSIFSFTGFLLALPAGFIMQRLGLRTTGLIAVGAVFIGSSLGTFCSTANSMLATRFIEGAGIGLITIVAPAAISSWFPAEMRGTPLGLWTTCMPVGSIIMFNLAPWLAELGGWQFIWKAGATFSLAAFILFGFFFRMPKAEEVVGMPLSSEVKPEHEEPPIYGKALANAGLWLIAVQFLCFNLICLALSTYYPTFLNSVRNYSLPAASFTFSLCTIAAVFSQPLGGYLSDRLGMRRHMIIISSVVLSVICMFPFIATGWMIPLLTIGLGVVAGTIVPATFAAVPEIMVSRQSAGLGMAVLALGQNLGMFIGPIMFGRLAESIGWTGAGYFLVPISAISVIAVCLAKFR
jgi:MFS family permease